ncbi:enoyl-CoA hydratase/isomerase family protein [Mycolicibacterium sp. XJ1819]
MITLEQTGAVRRLILNRPEKLNAMTAAMEELLVAELEDAAADTDTVCVVISGAGRAFCSGFDLDDMKRAGDLGDAAADLANNTARVQRWMRIRDFAKPLIAQVHGYCLGVANELVGCCDLIVCGESARFGMPEVREFALPPTLGFWPHLLGPARTKELLFTGRLVDGAEAVRLGLAVDVVDDESLAGRVDELAEKIATASPAALAVAKQAVNSWVDSATAAAIRQGPALHSVYHQAIRGDR